MRRAAARHAKIERRNLASSILSPLASMFLGASAVKSYKEMSLDEKSQSG